MFARDSGAGNGCASFIGAWKKCVLPAGKPHAHEIFRFRGGYFGFLGGWGSTDIIFYVREDFSEILKKWKTDFNTAP